MSVMTSDDFRSLLESAGLSQRALASRLGLATTTVNRWAKGELKVPQYAVAYLDLWCQVASCRHSTAAP